MTRKRRFLSHVEILTLPDPSPKRRKQNGDIEKEVEKLTELQYSPTVSEFEVSPVINPSKVARRHQRDHSPTVSDLEDGPRCDDEPVNFFGEISDSIIYRSQEDEEDEPLTILGEIGGAESEFDDLPVRLLQDFSIFEASSNTCIMCNQLTELDGHTYVAAGIASPWSENQEDKDEDFNEEEGNVVVGRPYSRQRIKLTKILDFNIHHFSDETEKFDGKIYIRTEIAWYILDSPSELYAPLFIPFFIQHRICHLVISSALENGSIGYEDFVGILSKIQDGINDDANLFAVSDILGRDLDLKDLEADEVKAYILSTLPRLCADNNIRVAGMPLIYTLFSAAGFGTDWLENFSDEGAVSSSESDLAYTASIISKRAHRSRPARTKRPHLPKISSNKELEVLKHRNETVVTPVVSRIVQTLFERTLWVEGTEHFNVDHKMVKKAKQVKSHHDNPMSMKWGPPIPGEEGYFQSVIMDEEEYSVGDVVMVMVGEDENEARAKNQGTAAAISKNQYANIVWFCEIRYFFEDEDPRTKKRTKMFHGQWFEHGSKTFLQETSHSRALYSTPSCDDNAAASIFRKCNVRYLAPGEDEEPDDEDPNGDDFFCGLWWDEKHWHLVDLPSQEEQDEFLEFMPQHKQCYACALRAKTDNTTVVRRTKDTVTHYGDDYHLHEFVYVRPSTGCMLDVAQIINLDVPSENHGRYVKVQYLWRHDDAIQDKKCTEERRLYLSRSVKKIHVEDIDGKCFVNLLFSPKKIEEWIKYDDHYYLNQKEDEEGENLEPWTHGEFAHCSRCLSERKEMLAERRHTLDMNGKLHGLELFSGAGGLGTGMNLSGFVDTKWAVEYSPSAASTYQLNHPNTTVYCQDTNLLLKHAISTHEGKKPPPLRSNIDEKQTCPNMPKKGEVDYIFGGPPCQAFSRANHWPKADDIKSTLPCNMLSYLEWYDANFFLLENVVGILGYPLKSKQSGRRLEGGIAMGMVKLIARTLIALGYQVQFKVLQAGQYGAPQGRERVIFWGAKRGLKIPEYPIPTHAFPRPAYSHTLLNNPNSKLYPVTRSKDPDPTVKHIYAPLKPVTVNDAIGDLPKFEWINPHLIVPETTQDKEEVRTRSETILQCEATYGKNPAFPGFPHPVKYCTSPQNAYQKWMREKTEERVDQHFTSWFNRRVVEITTTVPLRGNTDHRDLPPNLRPKCHPGAFAYGRLDGDSHFKTALTVCQPSDKGSRVLHPSQKRIVTVREAARAQGFPDHYQFVSINEDRPRTAVQDYHRQIGNAVPVPLARALGKCLGDALFETWKKQERKGSPPPV